MQLSKEVLEIGKMFSFDKKTTTKLLLEVDGLTLEELGDLVGFPVRQFQMYKEKKVAVKQQDNLSMVTATQRAAGTSLANLNQTVTKKVGQWVDELAVQEYLKNG